MPQPADRLLVDTATYAWKALDDLAISALRVTRPYTNGGGASAAAILLADGLAPASEMDRIPRTASSYTPGRRSAWRREGRVAPELQCPLRQLQRKYTPMPPSGA